MIVNKNPNEGYVMIIGSMKCGTTSLFNYLNKHPEICAAVTKEPEYFSNSRPEPKSIEDYEKLWSFDKAVHKFALEGSTGYTKYPAVPDVPRQIFELGLNPKFIYIVRNPIDRISSHYKHMRKKNDWLLDITDEHLINTSKYYCQLQRYTEFFQRKNILVLDYDKFKANPKSTMITIYKFLQLNSKYLPEDYKIYNKSKDYFIFDRLFYYRLFYNIRQIFNKSPSRPFFKPRNIDRCLSESEITDIRNVLMSDMIELNKHYGIDVEKWGFSIK